MVKAGGGRTSWQQKKGWEGVPVGNLLMLFQIAAAPAWSPQARTLWGVTGRLTAWPGSSRGQGWSSMRHTTLCVYSVISARVVTTLHTYSDSVNFVRSAVTPRRGLCGDRQY